MTQVFLGWNRLYQGCFLSRGSLCPALALGPPAASLIVCTLLPRLQVCRNDSDFIARDVPCHPSHAHMMLQPSTRMQRVVPLHTTAWLGGCCVLGTLFKPCLREMKSQNDSKRFCKICYELIVEGFFKNMWLVYTADSVCNVGNIGYRIIREI